MGPKRNAAALSHGFWLWEGAGIGFSFEVMISEWTKNSWDCALNGLIVGGTELKSTMEGSKSSTGC